MKNKKIYSSILVIVIIVGISIAGFVTVNYFKEEKLRSIAESICKDVGLVTSLNSGKTDKPIFIFDEIHNSIIGQIQNAIMLVRLYSQLNLRDIALEGYLLESEEIITDWYINASNGNNITKSKVAINLLKEGEISCAEFMKLVFDDIRLHRIEREVDYRIEVDSYAYSAPRLFLFKIASKDLNEKFHKIDDPEKKKRLLYLDQKLSSIDHNNINEDSRKLFNEYYDLIISIDSWANRQYERLKAFEDIKMVRSKSISETVNISNEIRDYADIHNVAISDDENRYMDQYIKMNKGRDKASYTMALNTGKLLQEEEKIRNVAMIIGVGHTKDVSEYFDNQGDKFITISPLSLVNNIKGYSFDKFDRKYKRMSLYSEGISGILMKSLLKPVEKKNEPVLSEPWFQAKAELYTFIDRIVHDMLINDAISPTQPPSFAGFKSLGPNLPPSIPIDTYTGQWISINPDAIILIYDDEDEYKITEKSLNILESKGVENEILMILRNKNNLNKIVIGKENFIKYLRLRIGEPFTEKYKYLFIEHCEDSLVNEVMFPVTINYKNPEKSENIWVKAGLNDLVTDEIYSMTSDNISYQQNIDSDEIENILLNTLKELMSNQEIVLPKVEDSLGRVQVTIDTIAVFGNNENAVREKTLGKI